MSKEPIYDAFEQIAVHINLSHTRALVLEECIQRLGRTVNHKEFDQWCHEQYGVVFRLVDPYSIVRHLDIVDPEKYTLFLLKYPGANDPSE